MFSSCFAIVAHARAHFSRLTVLLYLQFVRRMWKESQNLLAFSILAGAVSRTVFLFGV